MTQLMVREWVLCVSLPLSICVLVVFAANIVGRIRTEGWSWRFYLSEWNRAVIALTTFTLGVLLRMAWVWVLLREYEASGRPIAVEGFWWVDAVGGLLTVVGGLCVIREFSPRGWNWPWRAAAGVTLVWAVLVHL